MARLTARQMTQVKMPGAPAVPAGAPKKVAVKVPPGGEASVRRIDNGMVVTTRDSNWKKPHGNLRAGRLQLGLGVTLCCPYPH